MGSSLSGFRCALVAAGGLALLSGAARAQTLYVASHNAIGGPGPFSELYTIDKTTGATTLIGVIGFAGVTGLASLPDGRLVASAVQAPNSVLIDIDRTTGAGTLIGIIGKASVTDDCARVPDLAFDFGSNTLYGTGDRCNTAFDASLLIIDRVTGKGTAVAPGALGLGGARGAAADLASNQLYSCDRAQGLVIIDTSLGTYTLVGGPGSANAMAMDYAGGSSVAFGTTQQGDLITIDLTTGNETVVASTGLGLDAIAFDYFAPPAASCTFRNGLGGNPPIFTCTTNPVIGQNWVSNVSLAFDTVTTFVGIGVGGPTSGAFLFGLELLILPPFPLVDTGVGTHSIPVPSMATLFGVPAWSQGAQGNLSGVVLGNAQDLVFGS